MLDCGHFKSLSAAKSLVSRLCERIGLLDPHTALFFLTHYTAAPRLNYLLRSAPTFTHGELLGEIDKLILETASRVTNVDLTPLHVANQASLPIRHGGLGLRLTSDIALPCYIASSRSSLPLVQEICGSLNISSLMYSQSSVHQFTEKFGVVDLPSGDAALLQREWDEAAYRVRRDRLLDSANQLHRARLLASSAPNSGAWLQALPLPNLGLHLDDETVRVAVALRLGAPICQPHRCRCGQQVDRLGHHGLSCRYSTGRLPRHANLNDVVKRALAAAGIPSWLEPVGLDRGDGRRPDGLTVFPFSRGRSLCWDATCTDTFCQTAINATAIRPGAAADAKEEEKRRRYSGLAERYRFEPLAVETSGVLGTSSSKLLHEIGRRISSCTGDRRETSWLFQRVSVAVARGNATAVLASGAAPQTRR